MVTATSPEMTGLGYLGGPKWMQPDSTKASAPPPPWGVPTRLPAPHPAQACPGAGTACG